MHYAHDKGTICSDVKKYIKKEKNMLKIELIDTTVEQVLEYNVY